LESLVYLTRTSIAARAVVEANPEGVPSQDDRRLASALLSHSVAQEVLMWYERGTSYDL